MRAIHHVALSTLLAGLLFSAGGCGSGQIEAGTDATLPEGEDSAAFLDRVSSLPTVSENDALRGVLLLTDGADPDRTFAERVERLRAAEVASDRWTYRAERPITKGRLAYLLYQACDIPGGVVLSVAGPSQRYCLRELQYRGMISDGPPYAEVTGMEYVAVLGRADAWMRTGQVPEVLKTTWSR